MVGSRAEAEVTVAAGRSALTRFANSHIHQNVADDHHHARLKVVSAGRSATATSNRLDDEGLARLVERALAAAAVRPVDPGWPGLAPPAPAAASSHYAEGAHLAAPTVRAEVVRDFVDAGQEEAAAVGHGERLRAAGFCSTGGADVAFGNSAGQRHHARTSKAVLDGIQRTAVTDGKGFEIHSGHSPLQAGVAGSAAARKALTACREVEVEPGDWEVVLEPSCVADVVRFVTEHGFNALTHAEGRSFVRLGERQLDPALSLFADATDPRALGLPFDAEGTPRRRLDLVVEGVCRALAHDRRTAARAGTESTGHAVPGGETAGPVPAGVFLEPGAGRASAPYDLVASVRRGLLVTDFWYTRILDPKTQVVTGLTRNGTFLIERGEIVGGVGNLRFTQSYCDALAPGNVLGVGDDGRLAGESEMFVPTLHLKSWRFTGDARG